MECPHCGGTTGVVDTRPSGEAVRRRRACDACKHRFTTYERITELEPVVVKRDGRREPFQSAKVERGVRLAAAKRPLPEEDIKAIVEAVRARARQSARAEVSSETVGGWVWERLLPRDRVTAFRFASVFRRPDDTEALRRELAAAESPLPAPAPDERAQPPLPGIAGQGAAVPTTAPTTAASVAALAEPRTAAD